MLFRQKTKKGKDRSELNSHDNRALQKRQEPLGPKQRVSKTRQDLFSSGRLKSSLAFLVGFALLLPASASSTLVDCQSTGLPLSVQKNFTHTFSPETPVLGAPHGNSSTRWAAPWSPSLELLQFCPRLQCLFAFDFDAWKVLWQKACRHVEKVVFLFLRESLSFGNCFTPKDCWLPLFYLWFGFWGILAFWGWVKCLRERLCRPSFKKKQNHKHIWKSRHRRSFRVAGQCRKVGKRRLKTKCLQFRFQFRNKVTRIRSLGSFGRHRQRNLPEKGLPVPWFYPGPWPQSDNCCPPDSNNFSSRVRFLNDCDLRGGGGGSNATKRKRLETQGSLANALDAFLQNLIAEQPQAKSTKSFGKGQSVSKGKGKGKIVAENPQRQVRFQREESHQEPKAQLLAVGMCHWQGLCLTF